ncbi:MAG TPA: restriction endonuclease subunit S [Phycisphaerae bacterium]|nr:restriction endonuclease subunit S [Phycisphaerae bacterium]
MTTAQLHLGDVFSVRRQDGRAGLPVFAVTMGNGLVHRDKLERKTNGKLAPEEHLLIRKGDIAYNMMRMWQGASGLATTDGIVSPAYVVVAPTEGIDPLFASYWFKSARMIYLFWAYSYGITGDRLRLYYKDFARIPVSVPPKPRQKRIGEILSTTDRAIAGLEKLIAAKRKLKKGLAQQLLSGQRRLPGFSGAWTRHRLDTISQISKGAGGSKADLQPTGLPVVRYGELYTTYDVRIDEAVSFLSAEAARRSKRIRCGDVLLAGSGEDRIEIGTASAYMNGEPAYAGGDIIIVTPTGARSMFLAYLLDSSDVRREFYRRAQGESVVHIYMRDVASLELRLPSIEEQDRIAAVLGAADREIVQMEKKLAALRKLKKGLMQKLLSGS